jgi:hypothetical protein
MNTTQPLVQNEFGKFMKDNFDELMDIWEDAKKNNPGIESVLDNFQNFCLEVWVWI